MTTSISRRRAIQLVVVGAAAIAGTARAQPPDVTLVKFRPAD